MIFFIHLESNSFELSPNVSIDYALMEKTNKAMVIPLDADWHDIGSWSALYDISEKDENSNVIKGDAYAMDTSNSYIYADHHMVATVGVNNLVIVDTPDAILVLDKNSTEDVKKIVDKFNQKNRREQHLHRKVYRPWGWYDSVDGGDHFKVKRLHINSGSKLSLQSHKKRAEHWIVVSGTAVITCAEKIFTLKKNESTYIPINTKHRIENYGEENLEIIEVQSGDYFGEDDIVRYNDDYGRGNINT